MILKVIFANSVDPAQTVPLKSDLGPHCLPVCKNRFEKFARIFSRRHKQTTFSDAVFLGAFRVNVAQNYRCLGTHRILSLITETVMAPLEKFSAQLAIN